MTGNREPDLVDLFAQSERPDRFRRTRETKAARDEVGYRTETWGERRIRDTLRYPIRRSKPPKR